METKQQRIQNLLDRLDVLEGKSSKKTRIQGLLARLDTIKKEQIERTSRKKEIEQALAPKVRGLLARIRQAQESNAKDLVNAAQSFRTETKTVRERVVEVRNEAPETELKVLSSQIEALEKAFEEKAKLFETKDAMLEGAFVQLQQAVPDVSGLVSQDEVEKKLKTLEGNMVSRLTKNHGGNANRDIRLNSSSLLTKYTDLNIIPGNNISVVASANDTTGYTDLTFSSADLDRAATWGSITGTLSNQTDLQNALNTKISSVLTDGTLIQTAGPHLSRASIAGDVSIPQGSGLATLATVNGNVGTFGDSTTVSRVTVNAKGLVTAASNVGISFPVVPAGVTSVVAGTGITVDNTNSNAPVVNLGTASVTAGTYGSATQVGRFTVDAQGRLSAASVVGITFPTVPAGVTSVLAGGGIVVSNANPSTPLVERSSIVGDISIPQGSVVATLATVASNVGTFGSSTTVAQVQIDNKGRVVLASTIGIAFPTTTPAGANTQVQFNDEGSFGASSTFAFNKNSSVLNVQRFTASVITLGSSETWSAGQGKVFVSSQFGLTFNAAAGSSSDFAIFSTGGQGIVTVDADTSNIRMAGDLTMTAGNIKLGSNFINNDGADNEGFSFSSSGNATLQSTGVPLNVNSTNSNTNKIALQNNGSVVGNFGTGNGLPLVVSNGGGTQLFFFAESNGGELGIGPGTSAPSARLEVRTNDLQTAQDRESGIALVNATNATAGVPVQISPSLRLYGSAFRTGSSLIQQAEWQVWNTPIPGNTSVTSRIGFNSSRGGGAYTERVVFTDTGRVGIGTSDPHSGFDARGSMAVPINTQSSVYTLGVNDHTLLANASVAGFTVNLPEASSIAGRIYTIKKTDPTANAVTIDGNASQTIDGATTASIITQYQAITVQAFNSNWLIINSHK